MGQKPVGSSEHFTTCLLFQTGVFLLWLSSPLDFFHLFFNGPVSAPIRPTLLPYPGLGLASECIGLCTPKAKLSSIYRLQIFDSVPAADIGRARKVGGNEGDRAGPASANDEGGDGAE